MNLMALSLVHTHKAESWHTLHHRYFSSGPKKTLKAFFFDRVTKRFGEITFDPHHDFGEESKFARILMCYQPTLRVYNWHTGGEECEPF